VTTTEQIALIKRAEHLAGDVATLAAAIGVRQQTVYRWRNGARKMHGIAVRAVEQYIGECAHA
jgi:transposase-like protein